MRGQTTLDFAVGVSIFLLTVALVFTFVPSIVDPFVDDAGGDPMTVNRAADRLVGTVLGDPDRPGVLNETAVAALFPVDEETLRDRLGLPDTAGVNVTIERNSTVRYVGGDTPPNHGNVAVAWRVASLDGERVNVFVRVW